jgi:hypothetical protein
MNLNQLVIIICIVIFVWWVGGAIINRQRGQKVLNWLEAGFERMSWIYKLEWLKAFRSVGRLEVDYPRAPFDKLEIIFILEARENLLVWIFRHLWGRRDELILRAELQVAPTQELEACEKGRRGFVEYLIRLEREGESFARLPDMEGFEVARRGRQDGEALIRLRKFLAENRKAVLRLSLQRKMPHLLMRVNIAALQARPVEDFFTSLKDWLG